MDSRVILDYTGAESLLGRGDMLFLNPEVGNPIRAQGVMITDMEIERLICALAENGGGFHRGAALGKAADRAGRE